ncbi:conjugative transfer signal peptidase TraF [Mesorhizobium sp. M2A.F.Ca.ET.037.01.1.1]|uniref:conjugative transfer signal peptidase TraF n=2 Tax=Mesorhizobium TaxID=68287 RepID=UPI000FCC75AA|nr:MULTISPECIES: conjugative transfer signal peptidase TraF [unclassified Mesorhizobium]RUX07310.1 conjugative transfer signal peptidase TraF [Mesorhizobium sp. M2A.F.Ca.ET.037.01.1.1]RUY06346.1 conjugative transfer signal peptidase TraF [Mesorhizobium sp. M2A.F.Ca.ET.040.01.1.1]RWA91650.1 MAG: conjugative transfer signal peptidase TraF [Mesorhizobium sp.]
MSRQASIHLIGNGLRRIRARKVIVSTAIGLALIGLSVFAKPSPWLVWNASASAPVGLYRVLAGDPARGDLVLARTPDFIADLAAQRGYLPRNVPLVKRVVALSGEHVCAFNEAIIIAGKIVARRLATDTRGRTMPWWNDCRALSGNEVFLLNGAATRSFDSRYFGPVPTKKIIGRLEPLWTE